MLRSLLVPLALSPAPARAPTSGAPGPSGILALGTHGYTGLERAFLGTVAGDVLRAVKCDVPLVPPRTKAAETP